MALNGHFDLPGLHRQGQATLGPNLQTQRDGLLNVGQSLFARFPLADTARNRGTFRDPNPVFIPIQCGHKFHGRNHTFPFAVTQYRCLPIIFRRERRPSSCRSSSFGTHLSAKLGFVWRAGLIAAPFPWPHQRSRASGTRALPSWSLVTKRKLHFVTPLSAQLHCAEAQRRVHWRNGIAGTRAFRDGVAERGNIFLMDEQRPWREDFAASGRQNKVPVQDCSPSRSFPAIVLLL